MALDAPGIAWLRTPEGQQAAQEAQEALSSGTPVLRVVEHLRRLIGPSEARWAVGLAEGRLAARAKFADADQLYLDREAAEQATSEAVARHTAARFTGATRIADLGCGGGADALALARQAAVVAVDLDAGRAAMTQANAEVRGVPVQTAVADVLTFDLTAATGAGLLAGVDAAWLDPARRDGGGRVLDPERWSPPLATAIAIARRFTRAGIKVAPGIDLALVPDDVEVEFIALDGALVEAVLWLGSVVTAPRRATVLPSGVSIAGTPDTGATAIAPPGEYLYDLIPAVGRASLVDMLAGALDAWLLAPDVAYLSSDHASDDAAMSAFVRRFRILTWLPFSERQLLHACREMGASRVEVMRRASPVDTNALEVRLNAALRGSGHRVLTVALTRAGAQHIAIVCEREREILP